MDFKDLYFNIAGLICVIDLYIQLNIFKNEDMQKGIERLQDELLIPNIYFVYIGVLLLGWLLLPLTFYFWFRKKFINKE